MLHLRPLAASLLLIFGILSFSPVRAEMILSDNGAPPPNSEDLDYTTHPMTQAVQAEDFIFGQTQVITGLRFYGLERASAPGYAGSIYWSIRADDSGQPSAAEIAGATTSDVIRTPTGVIRPNNFNATEAIYSIDIEPLTLGTGHYWLVLHNGPLSHDDADNAQGFLLWEGTVGQRGAVGVEDPTPFDGAWEQTLGERSFFLVGVPEPAVTVALSGSAILLLRRQRARRYAATRPAA